MAAGRVRIYDSHPFSYTGGTRHREAAGQQTILRRVVGFCSDLYNYCYCDHMDHFDFLGRPVLVPHVHDEAVLKRNGDTTGKASREYIVVKIILVWPCCVLD
jgi:hypothetical protein